MVSDSGEVCHPCTSHHHVQIQVSSKERAPRMATKDLWLCPEDQALINRVQERGTRL